MSSVYKIKKSDTELLFLSKNGITVVDKIQGTQGSPYQNTTLLYETVVKSEKFGNKVNKSSLASPAYYTFDGNNIIKSKDIHEADFSEFKKFEDLSKLERYYLAILPIQENEHRTPEYFSAGFLSIGTLNDYKIMFAANYDSKSVLQNPNFTKM